ncbi:hypothetical protein [Azospira restricta]|uniref:EF-hand domain-containing protein n=1 Tax=Azospira restricta TaxID=404405 RepID=A0A974SRN0_9RHOO|nr:hypothetical protein [Azospira restricta]QRJ65245.1 hypothetical protein IWH25_07910 [Azospira restricta]
MTTPGHQWRFFRAGGFDQVRLDRGADLLHLDQLDQKLWVALSCPVAGLEFDAHTLALLDADGDGHVRASDLIAACQWAGGLLRDADLLASGSHPLPLAAIDDGSEDGRLLLASAREILKNLGKDGDAISAEDTADSARIFAATRFNGDGIITAGSTDHAALQAVIADLIACCGSRPDRSGQAGIGQEEVDAFFSDLDTFAAWQAVPASRPEVLPLGAASGAAWTAIAALREKVDDYFARCRLAEFDARAGSAMNGSDEDFRTLALQTLNPESAGLASLPLARIEAGRPLPLADGLNPAWREAVAALRDAAVAPLIGARDALAEDDWCALCGRFAAYAEWQAARPATRLEPLGEERIGAIAALAPRAALEELIARDRALEGEADAIAAVDRLVCYARDLGRLCNNFVAFRDFYTRQGKAVFQAGTLYLDGRSCDLVVPVLDAARHVALAGLSGIYLAYCECTRGAEKKSIAAAFTAGDADQLMVGRNGVFYDREGKDWDATITRIAEHPISIRQAFWSPYKKLARLLAEQVQKLTAAKAKSADDLVAGSVASAQKQAEAAKAAPAAAPAPFDAAKFAGIFAAIGLALGAIGTAVAAVVTGFLGLRWWQMPLAIGGLTLVVSGPAMAMAWFKLRNRNLGPLLDANGWAVNARAKINLSFGTSLTQLAKLPEGAERALADPYADRKTPWRLYLAALVLALILLVWATKSGGF